MPIAIRIETPGGLGMYSGDMELEKCFYGIWDEVNSMEVYDDLGSEDSIHPTPKDDPNLDWDTLYNNGEGDYKRWFFAFSSMAQMKIWTISVNLRKALNKYGYNLTMYSVPKKLFRCGEKQAVFVREESTLLHTLPVTIFD